jgi:hypothetical protein
MDVAMNPVELKTRLAAVPVYTVSNSKNEFVLIDSDVRFPNPECQC